MSLEHIFRNITDIRVFDIISCLDTPESASDIDEIIDLMDYNRCEQIQVQDSIDHLVKKKIIKIIKIPVKASTGCERCKESDEAGLPRDITHETHASYREFTVTEYRYCFEINKLTFLLTGAVLESSFLTTEQIND